jgi:tetrahydromethanopterin S-methyltransferase subunit B
MMSTQSKFGRVDSDNNVFLIEKHGERRVGQYPNVTPDEAMAFYERKFADLEAQVRILEQRVASKVDTHLLKKAQQKLHAELAEPNVVGDLENLRERVAKLEKVIEDLATSQKMEHQAETEASVAKRQVIADRAEALAAVDVSKIQWKATSTEFASLFEQWQSEQKAHPRVPKSITEPLWKRFSAARTKFETAKRAHFAQLTQATKTAKAARAELIKAAEKLAATPDASIIEYRKLLDQWKQTGKSNGKSDEDLWAKFKAAGDAIYAARKEQVAAENAELAANLAAKLELIKEAQKIDPEKDLATAKSELLALQQKWEKIGKVPREKVREVEDKFRAVEGKVKAAEQEVWRKSDPATKARTNSVVEQLEQSISKLEADLSEATKSKNASKVKEAEEALKARKAWLEVVLATAK